MSKSVESWSENAKWPLLPTQVSDAYDFGFRFAVRRADAVGLLTTRGQVDRLRRQDKQMEIVYILADGATRPCAKGKRT